MNGIIYNTLQATSSSGPKTSTTALTSNPNRIGFILQNQDNAKLYVKWGAGCSTSDYDMILKAGTAAADGTAGSVSMMEGIIYTGVISVASAGTPSYTITEFAP